jgi:hypothetical protein
MNQVGIETQSLCDEHGQRRFHRLTLFCLAEQAVEYIRSSCNQAGRKASCFQGWPNLIKPDA